MDPNTPIEEIRTTEKWDEVEGVLEHVAAGSTITVKTKTGPVSGVVQSVDGAGRSIEVAVLGKTKKIVFAAAALLLAIALQPVVAQPGRPLASVKTPSATITEPGTPVPAYLTDDAAARHAIDATQSLAREASVPVSNAWRATRTAVAKCEEAAKSKPDAKLPEPKDAAGDAAYVAACKALGVEIPFNPSVVAALGREIQTLYEASTAADYLRLKVKGREADAWRLPATMEPLGARVAQLLAFVQTAKLGVPPEAVDQTKRAFGLQ